MADDSAVRFDPPLEHHLAVLARWLPDADSCRRWAGPGVRYPLSLESLKDDLGATDWVSRCLVDEAGELLAFGQYRARAGYCHLGRLIVDPEKRGAGAGSVLLRRLGREGCRRLGVEGCSLFVYADNPAALSLYRHLGFRQPPGAEPYGAMRYLVVSRQRLLQGD